MEIINWAVYALECNPLLSGKKIRVSEFMDSHTEGLYRAIEKIGEHGWEQAWVCSHDEDGKVTGEYIVVPVAA